MISCLFFLAYRMLETQIPSPLSTKSEELRKQVHKLAKEIEFLKSDHAKELDNVVKAKDR